MRRRYEAFRAILIVGGLIILAAAVVIPTVREMFLVQGAVISAVVLTLVFLTLLPARAWLLAIPFAVVALLAVRWISSLKIAAIGLPLGYLDLVNVGSNPWALMYALGLGGMETGFTVLVLVVGLGAALAAAAALRMVSAGRVAYRLGEAALIAVLGMTALNAAAADVRDRLPQLYPQIEAELWQPVGQQRLARATGPLEYIAFTRLLGDQRAARVSSEQVPPLPDAELAAAAHDFLGPELLASHTLPNIVIVHAESAFDPNAIFNLAEPVALPLWTAGPDTRALAPLRVNTVGGASWVTEFEILTGVDSRNFGYHGFYTHQMIGPRVSYGFPAYLSGKGYETAAYYTEHAGYFGVADAFRNYGIANFYEASEIGIAADWSDTDLETIKKMVDFGAFTTRDQPKFSFVSTSYNHGPHPCRNFTDPTQFVTQFAGAASFEHNCMLNEFILRARSTSEGIEVILAELQRLERDTGRPYLVVVYGDHQPWSFTDGFFSVAGGVAKDQQMLSFADLRSGRNEDITFFHLFSSINVALPDVFEHPVPVPLLPTLLSAYVASDWNDLYLPANLLAYQLCGSDFRAAGCPLAMEMDVWGQAAILRAVRR